MDTKTRHADLERLELLVQVKLLRALQESLSKGPRFEKAFHPGKGWGGVCWGVPLPSNSVFYMVAFSICSACVVRLAHKHCMLDA
eukprot:432029-Pelagomonas_calceolata.AAC.2